MSSLALTQQLEQLNKQTEQMEKQIQEAKEQEQLEKIGNLSTLKILNDNSNAYIETTGHRAKFTDVRTKRIVIFSTQTKFEALYEIIKKQDDRIKKLETLIEQLS